MTAVLMNIKNPVKFSDLLQFTTAHDEILQCGPAFAGGATTVHTRPRPQGGMYIYYHAHRRGTNPPHGQHFLAVGINNGGVIANHDEWETAKTILLDTTPDGYWVNEDVDSGAVWNKWSDYVWSENLKGVWC